MWVDSWEAYGISSAHEGKFNLDGKDIVEQKMLQENIKLQKLKKDIFSQQGIPEINE